MGKTSVPNMPFMGSALRTSNRTFIKLCSGSIAMLRTVSLDPAEEYVTCHTCRSPETILQKDTRLYFLQCETCHSRCSVASIKTGFQAVTGKRAQLRAKAN